MYILLKFLFKEFLVTEFPESYTRVTERSQFLFPPFPRRIDLPGDFFGRLIEIGFVDFSG